MTSGAPTTIEVPGMDLNPRLLWGASATHNTTMIHDLKIKIPAETMET